VHPWRGKEELLPGDVVSADLVAHTANGADQRPIGPRIDLSA